MISPDQPIKLVLLDIGGVLVESGDYIDKSALDRLRLRLNHELSSITGKYAGARQPCSMASIEECLLNARTHYKNVRTERQPDVTSYVKRLLLEQANLAPSKPELARILDIFAEIEIRPIKPEAISLIQTIQAWGISWGIVANTLWPSHAWRSRILEDFQRYPPCITVWSTDIGYRKPSPRMLNHACRRASVPKENTIYVGNKVESDMAACSRAGVRGVYLMDKNQSMLRNHILGDRAPYLTITALAELETVIPLPPRV